MVLEDLLDICNRTAANSLWAYDGRDFTPKSSWVGYRVVAYSLDKRPLVEKVHTLTAAEAKTLFDAYTEPAEDSAIAERLHKMMGLLQPDNGKFYPVRDQNLPVLYARVLPEQHVKAS